ncbi:unnamed protein product [Gordionus sp. m RMFG-2023]
MPMVIKISLCLNTHLECLNIADILLFKGMTRGVIVEPRGDNGFGWDPCFEPDSGPNMNIPLNDARRLTFAQMPSSQKNSISHRSKALLNLRNYLIKKYFSK